MEEKFGYKGTGANMLQEAQYEIGKTFYTEDGKEIKQLADDVVVITDRLNSMTIPFYESLEDVFTKSHPNNGLNRFFKVKVVGRHEETTTKGKFVTNCLTIVEEVPVEELERLRKEKEEEALDKKMKIDVVRELQSLYPELIIGGSISLYLQGARLKRFKTASVDLDLVSPYFILLKNSANITIGEDFEERDTSDSDFQSIMTINGIKADLRTDPLQRYEIINYKDFDYKVTPLLSILKAKVEYAGKKWGDKHLSDLRELILQK